MSQNLFRLTGARRLGPILAAGAAVAGVPGCRAGVRRRSRHRRPFVVLGGSTVTNTGPSVLNGDLGVCARHPLVGFACPPWSTARPMTTTPSPRRRSPI